MRVKLIGMILLFNLAVLRFAITFFMHDPECHVRVRGSLKNIVLLNSPKVPQVIQVGFYGIASTPHIQNPFHRRTDDTVMFRLNEPEDNRDEFYRLKDFVEQLDDFFLPIRQVPKIKGPLLQARGYPALRRKDPEFLKPPVLWRFEVDQV
jgi:hypothetical protein